MAQEITFFQVLRMLLIMAAILVAVYYVTKLVANRSMTKGIPFRGNTRRQKGCETMPRILYRHMLDKENSIVLMEYDGYDYLMGVNGGSFTILEKRKLDEEEINRRQEELEQGSQETIPFSKYFEKVKENLGSKGVDKK